MLELTPKERVVAIQKAHDEFYFYSRWMMLQRQGIQWIRGPHHPIVCDALSSVYRGECLRLLINMPPRYSKTKLVTNFIGWGLGHYPDSEFMYLSYAATLAIDKTGDALLDVRSKAYREIFPEVCLLNEAQGHWKTTRGGSVYASGTSGTVTGFGAGKRRPGFGGALIIDDPHKPDEVFGPVRQKVIDNFQRTVENRLNWGNTPIIVIAHCLHEEDIIAWLAAGRNGEDWQIVRLPALSDDGLPLWPEMHSAEKLLKMRKVNSYVFESQYQQRPVPLGGAFFSRDNLFVDGQPIEKPEFLDTVYAIIDTANKAGVSHDGVGVVYYGKRAPDVLDKAPLVILDWDLTQIDGALLIDWIPSVFARLEELARECRALQGSIGAWIEDKGSGIVLLQQCMNLGLNSHPLDSKLTAVGKTSRCVNISGYVKSGQVNITREAYEKVVEYKGESKNHLMSQILRFTASFEDQGADDLLDGFSYGVAIGVGGNESF